MAPEVVVKVPVDKMSLFEEAVSSVEGAEIISSQEDKHIGPLCGVEAERQRQNVIAKELIAEFGRDHGEELNRKIEENVGNLIFSLFHRSGQKSADNSNAKEIFHKFFSQSVDSEDPNNFYGSTHPKTGKLILKMKDTGSETSPLVSREVIWFIEKFGLADGISKTPVEIANKYSISPQYPHRKQRLTLQRQLEHH